MKVYINVYAVIFIVKTFIQNLKMIQEDRKKKFIFKNRKC
jgi:hypothetical protein